MFRDAVDEKEYKIVYPILANVIDMSRKLHGIENNPQRRGECNEPKMEVQGLQTLVYVLIFWFNYLSQKHKLWKITSLTSEQAQEDRC
jgi:hypothetical protein